MLTYTGFLAYPRQQTGVAKGGYGLTDALPEGNEQSIVNDPVLSRKDLP